VNVAAVLPRLKILVADDDPIARHVVARSLRARFEVTEASDGQQAIDLFAGQLFDFVLLDVEMPRKTGVEAAEEMRALCQERFVPIILLSALEEVSTMVEGLARGADDFLPKPFNARVFESKLAVFLRIRDAQQRLRDQNQVLAQFQERTETEHLLAQEVFGRILARGAQHEHRVRISASALAMFNGDIALTARTASDRFRWLLADVAGHGLVGAIGTVPLSSMFYRTAKHDRTLTDALGVINEELHDTLPSSLFCACLAFELDATRSQLTVINCGMPDAYVVTPGGAVRALRSQNLPLSVVTGFEATCEVIAVEPGTRILAVSDGIVECTDPGGEMFGAERLEKLLASAPPDEAFDAVLEQVRAFCRGSQSDDISIVEVLV
jgi:serine phosphatase RsbU (regulator of sigma subunit)